MSRTIVKTDFEVRCTCDRCGRLNVRQSDGDIQVPTGWSFLHVSVYSNQHDGSLLCPSCLAFVIEAAAPAELELNKPRDKTPPATSTLRTIERALDALRACKHPHTRDTDWCNLCGARRIDDHTWIQPHWRDALLDLKF